MVTPPSQPFRRRLYIEEWRINRGLSVIQLAEKMGVSRQSADRYQDQQHRLTPDKMSQIARALDLEPQDLYRPPSRRSLDAVAATLTDKDYDAVFNLATDLAKGSVILDKKENN